MKTQHVREFKKETLVSISIKSTFLFPNTISIFCAKYLYTGF